jgi:isopentenyl diphosphate isomerase/L-lactate dehydrogenase-like FMN-dependent dehydrogenase
VPFHPATDAPVHDLVSDELPGGHSPAIDLSLEELETEARRVIGEIAYAYFAGGADDERLLAGNIEAWARWQLHPRVLAGVAGVDLATTLLGTAVSSPVVIAPTAVQGLAHGDGEIADAVGDRAEVYVDGGIRRAPDVMKALALGARAVLIGRPSLWALAAGGADGVASLLRWYEAELRRTMALCGTGTIGGIDRSLVRRAP